MSPILNYMSWDGSRLEY